MRSSYRWILIITKMEHLRVREIMVSFGGETNLDGKHLRVWEICKQFRWILRDPINLSSHLWEQQWLRASTFERRYQLSSNTNLL